MHYLIVAEEVCKYERNIVVDIPDAMSEDDLNKILLDAERVANYKESFQPIYDVLQESGIKIVEWFDDDMGSPTKSSYEIYDVIRDESEDIENEEE